MFRLIEESTIDGVKGTREVAVSHRLSAMLESDAVLDALESEVVADLRQRRAAAERKFDTPDVIAVKRDPFRPTTLLADEKPLKPFPRGAWLVAPPDDDDSDDLDTDTLPFLVGDDPDSDDDAA